MSKIFKSLLSLSFVLMPFASGVNAANLVDNNKIVVEIDGNVQSFEQSPVLVNDITLVPLRGIFEELGAKVKWDNNLKKVTADKGNDNITLTIGSKKAYKNGAVVDLDVEANIINQTTMVPLRFVSESLGSTVNWDNQTKKITISAKNEKEQIKENDLTATDTLTQTEAVQLAIKNSITLKNLDEEVERLELVKDKAIDNVTYIPGYDGSNPLVTGAYKGSVQAQLGYDTTKKQIDLEKDKLEYNVILAYNNVVKAQKQSELAKLALEYAEINKRVVQAEHDAGNKSNYELQKVKASYDEALTNHNLADKNLKSVYMDFNHLVGFSSTEMPTLDQQLTFEQFGDTDQDLETHITRVLNDSTAVWLAEQKIKLEEFDVNYYTFNSKSNAPYDAEKIDVDKAENDLVDTKRQLEKGIRSLYVGIKQVEEKINDAESQLNLANETLKLAEVQYDVGMSTFKDLVGAKLNVAQKEQEIFNNIAQQQELKYAYNKPWVAAK